jgi:multidrug efflux pump subunit AcrA (membrane-fusion protein)
MKTQETTTVRVTEAELAELQALREEKAKKEAADRRKAERERYAELVDAQVKSAVNALTMLSDYIAQVKKEVFFDFETILAMKAEVMEQTKDNQRTHTFTTSDSSMRITLGVHTVDGYRDTVEDGIAMVMEYIQSLATDDNSRVLVSAITRLLARDKHGTIKASRVLQLRKMAEESGNEKFMEGVKIIEESYQPTTTKRFLRAEIRDTHTNAWVSIPLSVTEAE